MRKLSGVTEKLRHMESVRLQEIQRTEQEIRRTHREGFANLSEAIMKTFLEELGALKNSIALRDEDLRAEVKTYSFMLIAALTVSCILILMLMTWGFYMKFEVRDLKDRAIDVNKIEIYKDAGAFYIPMRAVKKQRAEDGTEYIVIPAEY